MAASTYNPTTQRIELDATGVLQLTAGTYALTYYYYFDDGSGVVQELNAQLTGTVSVEDGILVIDISQNAPAHAASRIVLTEFELTDKCEHDRLYNPWDTFSDQDMVTFVEPLDGGEGGDWTAGCVFEGAI